jgi:hypothetical protein
VLGHVHSDAVVQPPHSKKLADPQRLARGSFAQSRERLAPIIKVVLQNENRSGTR